MDIKKAIAAFVLAILTILTIPCCWFLFLRKEFTDDHLVMFKWHAVLNNLFLFQTLKYFFSLFYWNLSHHIIVCWLFWYFFFRITERLLNKTLTCLNSLVNLIINFLRLFIYISSCRQLLNQSFYFYQLLIDDIFFI